MKGPRFCLGAGWWEGLRFVGSAGKRVGSEWEIPQEGVKNGFFNLGEGLSPETSSVSSGSSSSILQKLFQISPQPHPILGSSLHWEEGSLWLTASASFIPDLEDQASPLYLGSHLSCFFPSQGTWARACPCFHPGSLKMQNESVSVSIS